MFQSLSCPPSRCSSTSAYSISAHVALIVILDRIVTNQHPVGLLVLTLSPSLHLRFFQSISLCVSSSVRFVFLRISHISFHSHVHVILSERGCFYLQYFSSFVTFRVVITPMKFCDIDFPRWFPCSSRLN